MQNQASLAEATRRTSTLVQRLTDWFIPASLLHRQAHRGLAQVFVQTHLIGAVLALLMLVSIARIERAPEAGLGALAALVLVFAALPFLLRHTGNLALAGLLSFQVLGMVALVGTFQYGGFGSPFLPWLLVSLLSGLFYQSKRTGLVLGLFIFDMAVFFVILSQREQPELLPAEALRLLSWISIGVAMTYMAFMARYYSHITASRAELLLEAERYRAAALELEQARAVAEQLNRNRSQFFAKMSHELRTPLNAIIGYSELLIEDCAEDSPPNAQRSADLARINATGKHLLSLVSDVLDADRIESGALSVEVSRFTLGRLCDEVAANAKALVEANGNKFVIICPLRDDEMVSDVKKLRQMLLNLLSNAAKFTTNGTVTLELWLERGLADDRLHAAVRDTGIGMAPDVLPQLFETYMQADATIQGRFGGTGIGLALTRKFSVLLGGSIAATSRVGEGSCFTIDLPAEIKASGREAVEPDTPPRAAAAADPARSAA